MDGHLKTIIERFLSRVFVERKTRLLVSVSGFQIENAQNEYGLPRLTMDARHSA
jgi:hypothetical protein